VSISTTRIAPALESRAGPLAELAVIDTDGWEGPAAQRLLSYVRAHIVCPQVAAAGLRGPVADQAEATGWAVAWEAMARPSIRIAILGPALLLLVFAVVQAGLWFFARSLALAAAQEGVAAPRAYDAPGDAGVARAWSFLDRSAGDSLQAATVSTAGSTATTLRVEVRGRALSILPGVPGLPVSQAARAPVERFTVGGGP
jgi:hypothetical protein